MNADDKTITFELAGDETLTVSMQFATKHFGVINHLISDVGEGSGDEQGEKIPVMHQHATASNMKILVHYYEMVEGTVDPTLTQKGKYDVFEKYTMNEEEVELARQLTEPDGITAIQLLDLANYLNAPRFHEFISQVIADKLRSLSSLSRMKAWLKSEQDISQEAVADFKQKNPFMGKFV